MKTSVTLPSDALSVLVVRPCAGCTQCCSLVSVKEIALKPFTRCPKLRDYTHVAGPGCGVYANRPQSCRSWTCMWTKADSDWPEELRPDRCGVVFDELVDVVKINGKELPAAQAWVRAGKENAFRESEPIRAVIYALLDKGLVVLWRTAGEGGVQMACAILRNPATGLVEVTRTMPASNDLGGDAERFIRAGELAEKMGIEP